MRRSEGLRDDTITNQGECSAGVRERRMEMDGSKPSSGSAWNNLRNRQPSLLACSPRSLPMDCATIVNLSMLSSRWRCASWRKSQRFAPPDSVQSAKRAGCGGGRCNLSNDPNHVQNRVAIPLLCSSAVSDEVRSRPRSAPRGAGNTTNLPLWSGISLRPPRDANRDQCQTAGVDEKGSIQPPRPSILGRIGNTLARGRPDWRRLGRIGTCLVPPLLPGSTTLSLLAETSLKWA